MLKNVFKIVAIFLVGMVGGIFADQIFWPYFVERPLFYQYRLEKNPVYVTEIKEFTIEENIALKLAIAKVEKTVIGIKTETEAGEILEGSGLIVTSDGLMVTLASLVPTGSDFLFYVDAKPASYQILKRDLTTDLALVKLGGTNLPTVSFANFEKMELGERVFLVGLNFVASRTSPSLFVNEGIVKSFTEDFIETNIIEKSTLKGSPLFNIQGEILGLNKVDLEGKVMAVPVSQIKKFVGM